MSAAPASLVKKRGRHHDFHEPRTVDELTEQNVRLIHRLESVAQKHLGRLDCMANAVSRFCGSSTFLAVHVVLFLVWIGANAWPGGHHWDPYPFTFLTLVVSLEAIFLSAFILISQNQAAKVSERRNQLDLQINLLTEQENTKMLKLLDGIAKKLDVQVEGDPSMQVLEQAMQPDKLAEQIERVARKG
jgi:uncharacterized membrane protein